MKQAFSIFDKNGDGFISRIELRMGLEKLHTILTDKELDTVRLNIYINATQKQFVDENIKCE